eukprot:15356130-Ditylum_brightwellii.AAC.1
MSEDDECVFYRGKTMFLCYVNDGIFIRPLQKEIEKAIADLRNKGFNIKDKGSIEDYVDITIKVLQEAALHLMQPQITQSIIDKVPIPKHLKDKSKPLAVMKQVVQDKKAPLFNNRFHYRRVIGKMNYSKKDTRLDILCPTHLCAWFCEDLREPHAAAVKHAVHYLHGTRNHIEARQEDLEQGNCTRRPWYGTIAYMLHNHLCKLPSSVDIKGTINFCAQHHRKEIKDRGIADANTVPEVHYKCFEDNLGALEFAKLPKMQPHTKHINLVWHHFWDYIRRKLTHVIAIKSEDQPVDIMTKSVEQNGFVKHCKSSWVGFRDLSYLFLYPQNNLPNCALQQDKEVWE